MKQCCNCKKEVGDKAVLCMHCGCFVDEQTEKKFKHMQPQGDTKRGIGILMALFVVIAGLIMGLCIYAPESIERKTFVKSWIITTAILAGVSFLIFLLFVGLGIALEVPPPGTEIFIRW